MDDSPVIRLELELCEPQLVAYFKAFAEPERSAKAIEAIKVGVIALQTACPTLDTQIVKDRFAEMQKDFGEALKRYFAENDGIVPKSLNNAIGEKGALSQFLLRYFDPETGRLARLMDAQVGPTSRFAKHLDPKNKDGVLAAIEGKVEHLLQARLGEVLAEFSLDNDKSAMSRLSAMIASGISGLSEARGVRAGRAAEAERGHVKGFNFEEDLYQVIAEMGRQFGDTTELVRGMPGRGKCKVGDHLIALGEATGAPGLRIVVEAKDQKYKAKNAIKELQEAKKNREAVSGIFVFSEGSEPTEFGNFKRIDNDFYCTVDKSALAGRGPLPFLWAAYEISRVQAVAAVHKEAGGTLDLERIQQHIDGIASWVPRLADIITKANTVKRNGEAIETTARDIRDDIKKRTDEVLRLLRLDSDK